MNPATGKKKTGKNRVIVELLITAVLLCGCGRTVEGNQHSDNIQQNKPTEQNAEPLEQPLTRTTFLTEEEMALADMWPSCDDGALAELMRRADSEEEITVACIGGSITQGTIAQGTLDDTIEKKESYAYIFRDWWQERFPNTKINFINAGIGGTDSYLAIHRLERDVMCYEPDLVLVEFSVNDGNDNFYKKTYDNLVYNLLNDEKKPAVMLLFMAQTNGISAQTNDCMVGFNYKVPMVSYANVMSNMLETGRFTEKDLAGDGVHPSALGHAITGEILWNYLNNVYAARNEIEYTEKMPEALTKAVYSNARILDSENITPDELGDFKEEKVCQQFENGWGCDGEGGIVFTAQFSRMGLLYYATTDGKSGQFEVLVDGVSMRNINADFTGGWGNAIKNTEIYSSDEAAVHTVEIRRAENSTGDVFHLLGLLVSE